jgi:hypothetical protein
MDVIRLARAFWYTAVWRWAVLSPRTLPTD